MSQMANIKKQVPYTQSELMNKKTDNINYSIGLLGKCSYVVRSINNKVSAVVETFMLVSN